MAKAAKKSAKEASNLFHNIMKASVKATDKEKKYIPADILDTFTTSYEKEDVWKIHSGDYWLMIFLYTDKQIDSNKDLPKYNEIKKGYLELVKKFLDPTVREIHLTFDSKENFDKKYDGNWEHYYH
ncbi:MAG: hypothetical protein ABUT20_26560 [Bacteroidota bacterium]